MDGLRGRRAGHDLADLAVAIAHGAETITDLQASPITRPCMGMGRWRRSRRPGGCWPVSRS